ncbi:MAG: (2Fe-2S)-binding protein [Myxococcota bacterium]
MILCLCEGTSDRQLREAVRDGCDTVRALAKRTGAGTHCGQCACDLKRIVAEARRHACAQAEAERESIAAK